MIISELIKIFEKNFKGDFSIFSAPGRINIIGEHTDYNNGFVLPASIDKTIELIINLNNSNNYNIIAYNENQKESFSKDIQNTKYHWSKYIYGVISEISKLGFNIPGFDCVFGGNIPVGSGLSSSAALESVFCLALNELLDLKLTRFQLAKIGQSAEHKYVGVQCGIMDQFASLFGEKDYVIKLDCQFLEYELIPFKSDKYKLILFDSQVKHNLATTEYNKRRESCESGVNTIAAEIPGIKSLRDVNIDILNNFKHKLNTEVFNRCLYVIKENERLSEACKALKNNDFVKLGQLMYKTHQDLSNLYEVSCEELDFLVEEVIHSKFVSGSRMMGGGFGGCTINLVENTEKEYIIRKTSENFFKRFGITPKYYEVVVDKGASRIQ